MEIGNDIYYIGVNDHNISLFEGQYRVPYGMSYNSYVIKDEKIAVIDTVEVGFTDTWLNNLKNAIGNKQVDYLIIQHMEPDHSGSINGFLKLYPNAKIVSSQRSFVMMKQFFGNDYTGNQMVIENGSLLSLGKHDLTFVSAPMVHWPEVTVTFDKTEGVLFSADAFGKFGANDVSDKWEREACKYYFGIVGKFGPQVQVVLKKINDFDIKKICPAHGPVLEENLSYYIGLYDTWSRYLPQKSGVVIAYTSVYGNTKKAVLKLADLLKKGGKDVKLYNLAQCDMTDAIADAFCYDKLVLATTTYNSEIFPFMKEFISHLTERNYQGRVIGLIENGSWAPMANKVMKNMLEKSKNIQFTPTCVKILSSLNEESKGQLEMLARELIEN